MSKIPEKNIEWAEKEANRVWDKLLAFSSYGFNKCCSYNTLIYRFTGNQYYPKEITLEQFYKMKDNENVSQKYRKQGHMGKVRSYNPETGKVEYNYVKDIHYNGKRIVYKITLENGMFIKITANHRLMLSNEKFKLCIKLEEGDELMICGDKWVSEKTSYIPSGLGKDWISNKQVMKNKQRGDNLFGGKTQYIHNLDYGWDRSKKIVKERADGLCEFCGNLAKGRMEIHHADGNNKNHHIDNLMYLHNGCHKILDYKLGLKHSDRSGGYHALTSKIKSIEKLGYEDTYDLEMVEEPRNFIANGIVSHNSHSAAYSIMGYWGQWIKAHYPLVFWTTALQFAKNEEETILYLCEKERHFEDINVVPPDINKAEKHFRMDPNTNTIYWSILKIKNLADKSSSVILKERKENGDFMSVEDFFERMKGKRTGKQIIESLIIAGAFDSCYNITQSSLFRRRELMLKVHGLTKTKGGLPTEFNSDFAKKSNYFWQIEQQRISVLGFIDFFPIIKQFDKKLATKYKTFQEIEEMDESGIIAIAGIIDSIFMDTTKKGKKYAKVVLKSNLDFIRFFMWEEALNEYEQDFQTMKKEKTLVCITLKNEIKEGSGNFLSFHDKLLKLKQDE